MKSFFTLAFLTLLMASCYSPQKNCKAFKTGTFIYHTYANGELIEAKIVRNDSIEIDYYHENHPDTSAIRWVNDCEYILTKYNADETDEKQAFQMRIVETKKDSYTFVFSKVGEPKTKEFTATRLKK